ncbi:MAG: pilus assembly protein TadG-related protein [Paracoccaceae bacterium]
MLTYFQKRGESSALALASGLQRRLTFARSFARDDEGVMTYFALCMLLMMLLVGGIGIDLMRNELERSKLQATLDRAVLAAADLEQTLSPTDVVTDYFDKAGMADHLATVTVNDGLNFRTVQANASTTSPTRFMKFVGVDDLPVPAVGTAEERVNAVEISVVLDISGSMGSNNKMGNLQDAAKTFVDTVIKPENQDLISMSIVPYTAQVNAGSEIFDQLNATRVHSFSECVDFDQSDFSSTSISLSKNYEQMQHFEAGYSWSYPIGNPGCPQQSYEEIQAFSQDATALKSTIDEYTPRANTAIHLGMKWGVAMVDPSFRPITAALTSSGDADPTFANRPVDYSDTTTLKTVILMTDGQNVSTYRIQPRYYAQNSHYVHWSRYPLFWYLNNYVGGSWNDWRYLKYSSSQADTMLSNICSAAKTEGIVIWSIGFEVTDFSAGIMRDCASSPSHFFRVEGVEISDAFEAIAKQINQLRLTQ